MMPNLAQLAAALIAAVSLGASAAPAAKPHIAYPGSLPAQVTGIESAMVVKLDAQTWPGFRRAFRITLPGIQVPEDTRDAPTCQREMAERALTFTETFLYDAEQVEVRDILMTNTGDPDGRANIYTEQGSLADALQAAGLARPGSVDPDRPWCP
jgi:hypothetical protein